MGLYLAVIPQYYGKGQRSYRGVSRAINGADWARMAEDWNNGSLIQIDNSRRSVHPSPTSNIWPKFPEHLEQYFKKYDKARKRKQFINSNQDPILAMQQTVNGFPSMSVDFLAAMDLRPLGYAVPYAENESDDSCDDSPPIIRVQMMNSLPECISSSVPNVSGRGQPIANASASIVSLAPTVAASSLRQRRTAQVASVTATVSSSSGLNQFTSPSIPTAVSNQKKCKKCTNCISRGLIEQADRCPGFSFNFDLFT